jgi:hypothetical protein
MGFSIIGSDASSAKRGVPFQNLKGFCVLTLVALFKPALKHVPVHLFSIALEARALASRSSTRVACVSVPAGSVVSSATVVSSSATAAGGVL